MNKPNILQALNRIADALESLVPDLGEPEPNQPEPNQPDTELEAAVASLEKRVAKVSVSLADVQILGHKLIDAGRQDELRTLLTEHGGAKLSTLHPGEFEEVHVKLKALLA